MIFSTVPRPLCDSPAWCQGCSPTHPETPDGVATKAYGPVLIHPFGGLLEYRRVKALFLLLEATEKANRDCSRTFHQGVSIPFMWGV